MNKNKNNGGYALLWTTVVLLVISLLTMAAMSAGMYYNNQTINQTVRQQSYYTALSAVETVASQLTGLRDPKTEEGKKTIALIKKLEASQMDEVVRINDMGFPKKMGKCSVEMKLVGSQLHITATATHNDSSYTLTGIMEEDDSLHYPKPDKPGEPDYGGDGTPGIGSGDISGNGTSSDENTDIYIWDPITVFTVNATGSSKDAVVMGKLYSIGKRVQIGDRLSGKGIKHVHGEIVTTCDIGIGSDATVGYTGEDMFLPAHDSFCKNTNANVRVHTTGVVDICDKSSVAADVTGNIVMIRDSAMVRGKITGDTINVDGNNNARAVMVDGNITGNVVTLGGNAVVNGNITADVLMLQENASVVGSITANSIVMDSGGSGKITGNVTAGSVTMKNGAYVEGSIKANSLIMSEQAQVHGDVTVDSINMSQLKGYGSAIVGTLSFFDRKSQIWVDKVNSIVQLTVKPDRVAISTPIVGRIASEVPPIPNRPVFEPKPPATAIRIDHGGTVSLGSDDGSDSYYFVDKNINITKLEVHGTGRVYLYIDDMLTIDVQSMTSESTAPPNLFFILGKRSCVTLGRNGNNPMDDKNFYAYVWAEKGNEARLDEKRGTIFNGGIWVDKVQTGNDCEYHWIVPSLGGGGSGGGEGGGTGGDGGGTGGDGGGTGGEGGGTGGEEEEVPKTVWKLTRYVKN